MNNAKFAVLAGGVFSTLAVNTYIAYKAKKTVDQMDAEIAEAKNKFNGSVDHIVETLQDLKY